MSHLVKDNQSYRILILIARVRGVKTKMINFFELQDVNNVKLGKW